MSYYLSTQDFSYKNDNNGRQVISINYFGAVLVVFYSYKCSVCKNFIPNFKQMSNKFQGCKFALCNIDTNYKIPELSTHSTTPITYVPTILLYYDGIPIIEYPQDADRSINLIGVFISNTLTKLQSIGYIKGNKASNTNETISLNDNDDNLYKNYDDAYK